MSRQLQTVSSSPRLLSASIIFLLVAAHLPTVVADAQCYAINGQKSSGTPCNAAATGQVGSHAACCDESKQEACLATGVCFATQRSDNNTFWAEGCTDPTGLDPSCPQYCGTASPFVTSAPIQATYTVMSCGGSAWCCCFDNFGKSCNKTDCCTKNNFTLARGLGAVVRQFTANANTDAPANSSSSNTTGSGSFFGGFGNGSGRFGDRNQRLLTVIVAAVLGALLLASLVAFGFSCSRARHLRRQVDRLQQEQKTAGLTLSSTTSSPLEPSRSPRSRSLRIETQGLVGVGMPQHLSAVKDDVVSPMSYEQLNHLHQQQQLQQQQQQQYSAGGIRRSSSSSFHQIPPPPFTVSQQQQQQYHPSQQQQLSGFNFNIPQRTPSWTRGDTIRHNNNMGRPLVSANTPRRSVHDTAELPSPLHIPELPAEKYMG